MPVLCPFSIPLEMPVPESFIDFKTGISNWDNRGVSLVAMKVGETPLIVLSDNFVVFEVPKFAAHALTDISAETIKVKIFLIYFELKICLLKNNASIF